MLCRARAWHTRGWKSGLRRVSSKRCNSIASNRYSQQLRRIARGRKISRRESKPPRHSCGTHGAASVVVQVALPVRHLRFAKGNLNLPLTPQWQSKSFGGSRLKPSKADSRRDQKGKRRAICTVEADPPCIPQGKQVPDAGSRDLKNTDPQDHWCDLKSASNPC